MINFPYILIYGFGNPGRQDDAAGVMLTERIEKWAKNTNIPVDCDYNYQLTIEDSYKLKSYKVAVFIDSTINENIETFDFKRIFSSSVYDFSSHIIRPEYLLYLSEVLFNHEIEAYILEIRGFEWNLMKKPTKNLVYNLSLAEDFLKKFLTEILLKK